MKKIILYIHLILLLYLGTVLNLFAQNPEAPVIKDKEITLNLINTDEEDYTRYYLPLLESAGYLFRRNYYAGEKLPDYNTSTLNIIEDTTIIDGKSFTRISSSAVDASGFGYLLEFSFSDGYNYSGRKAEAADFTINLFLKTRTGETPEIFSETLMDSLSIGNLTPEYGTDENGDYLKGYDFNYSIQRTPSYYAYRTAGEILFANILGVGNYYMNKFENKVDWQYDYNWDDAKQKVKDGWYWDPNNFNTNTIYHLYAGVTYYQIARSNNYNIWESLAWTFGGSFFWEFFGEWREQVSLNDMIFTPMLGAVTGEALIQTSFYIEKNIEPGILREILYFTVNPFGWLNKMLDSSNNGDMRVRILFVNPLQMKIDEKIKESISR